jgi:RNA polymerase sigma-70 factor (ECF subfamily)
MARWRDGDEEAASEIYRRYGPRLRALARSRLPAHLARRVDPDDIVQSACGSFFAAVRQGRYVLKVPGDLWRLLAAVTVHKLQHHLERQAAGKRTTSRERHFGGESSLHRLGNFEAVTTTPSQAAAAADMLDLAIRGLGEIDRRIVELRLQGHRVEEIAVEVRRSERTVRRVLEQLKDRLQAAGVEWHDV